MTKKSAGRLARDADQARREEQKLQLKDNKCWDELNDLYGAGVQLLLSHKTLIDYLCSPHLRAYLSDPDTTIRAAESLSSDLVKLSGELLQIHALHDGKTGGSDQPDEVWRAIEIHEMYFLFNARHDGVVMPTVAHLAELLDEANRLRQQAVAGQSDAALTQAQVQEANAPAPIDVVAREVSPAA